MLRRNGVWLQRGGGRLFVLFGFAIATGLWQRWMIVLRPLIRSVGLALSGPTVPGGAARPLGDPVPRIGIVTATNRRSELLLETMHSVLSQFRGPDDDFFLEYVVIDGSRPSLRPDQVESIRSHPLPAWISFDVVSEPDSGLGDALAKGFRRIRADYYGYINSGDLLSPMCLRNIAAVARTQQPDWMCGLHATYDAEGALVRARPIFRYRHEWIAAGMYGRTILPSIQQESTFWSRSLMNSVPLEQLAEVRTAVDHYLWSCFSRLGAAPLAVDRHLGGFREHGGHLSSSPVFREEMDRLYGAVSLPMRVRAWPERLRWFLYRMWRTLNASASRRQRTRGVEAHMGPEPDA